MPGRAGDEYLTVRMVGGPTAVLEIGGLRLLTDPTFDPPGPYDPRPGVHLEKTRGPAAEPDEIGSIDAVLLSHDQHLDNLDRAGRTFLARCPLVLTTVEGAARLGKPAAGLPNWELVRLSRANGPPLRITGVPARHGPEGAERVAGQVTGFVLAAENLPTVYVSGDNASLEIVEEVAARVGPVDVAVLFAGGARLSYLDGAYLTFPSESAAEAARILGAARVVPVHIDGWAHLTDGASELRAAFEAAGLGDRLTLLSPGQTARLG